MPGFQLGEEQAVLFNAMPAISQRELYVAAGHVKAHVAELDAIPAFEIDVFWSAGAERQSVTVLPQRHIRVPKSLALALMRQFGEKGVAMLTDEEFADEPTRDGRALEAVDRAIRFYTERGDIPLRKYMQRQGVKRERDIGPARYQCMGWILNARKVVFLRREMTRLQSLLRRQGATPATAHAVSAAEMFAPVEIDPEFEVHSEAGLAAPTEPEPDLESDDPRDVEAASDASDANDTEVFIDEEGIDLEEPEPEERDPDLPALPIMFASEDDPSR